MADELPPTQNLIMEVLAARHRLGEVLWPFPSNLAVPLRALEERGLVTVMHGNVQGTVRASLTATGSVQWLDASYFGELDRLRLALKSIAEFAEARADLVPGMQGVAATARNALEGGR